MTPICPKELIINDNINNINNNNITIHKATNYNNNIYNINYNKYVAFQPIKLQLKIPKKNLNPKNKKKKRKIVNQ